MCDVRKESGRSGCLGEHRLFRSGNGHTEKHSDKWDVCFGGEDGVKSLVTIFVKFLLVEILRLTLPFNDCFFFVRIFTLVNHIGSLFVCWLVCFQRYHSCILLTRIKYMVLTESKCSSAQQFVCALPFSSCVPCMGKQWQVWVTSCLLWSLLSLNPRQKPPCKVQLLNSFKNKWMILSYVPL